MKIIFALLLFTTSALAEDLGKAPNTVAGSNDTGIIDPGVLPKDSGIPLLGMQNNNMYGYISVDKLGRTHFSCQDCPNKFCKEFACTLTLDATTHVEKGNCECEK